MKSAFAGLLVLAFVYSTGCNLGTRGGPGATNPNASKPLYGQANDTFNLSVPTLSTAVTQGETKATSIGIKRGMNFDEEVKLTFTSMPKGVTFVPSIPVIKRGETEAKVALTAADDASLGDFTVLVTGHPTAGADASNELQITVAKR
jgi:hypothetical protein